MAGRARLVSGLAAVVVTVIVSALPSVRQLARSAACSAGPQVCDVARDARSRASQRPECTAFGMKGYLGFVKERHLWSPM